MVVAAHTTRSAVPVRLLLSEVVPFRPPIDHDEECAPHVAVTGSTPHELETSPLDALCRHIGTDDGKR